MLRSGDVFANRFEVHSVAGAGGMGTVYRALDRFSGDTVAVKLLQGQSADPNEAERFLREAELLNKLRHTGVVGYVAHGVTPQGQRFLAMEWLDGEDLAHRLRRGPLTVRDSIVLIQAVSSALAAAAHERGIIHRDLKPSNLFLRGGDPAQVTILDFGIARQQNLETLTSTGLVLGTPEYMAPEQARAAYDLSPAADIFSLGCILYHCLTGKPPFNAEHVHAILIRVLFEEPAPISQIRADVPEPVIELVHRMLEKEPSRRIANAGELAKAIALLRDVDMPTLSPTFVTSRMTPASFAETEKTLVSLVVASSLGDAENGGSSSSPGAEDPPGHHDLQAPSSAAPGTAQRRDSLLATLRTLGVQADFLAGGSLVVTVRQTGSATDQVKLAARVALLIHEHSPSSHVAVATGLGLVDGATAVGEVADRAARLLDSKVGQEPSALEDFQSGVWLDKLTAGLIEPHFSITSTRDGARLVRENKEVDVSRPLLGKPTPCVGRDSELATLDALFRVCRDECEARAALITAPPGAGKSRLRHEFLRRIEKQNEPATVLLGRGDLISAGAPYGTLADAIRRFSGLSGGEAMDEQCIRLREQIGRHVAPQEKERVVAFLGELCGIHFKEHEASILRVPRADPKAMSDGIRRALVDWLRAECGSAPVALVLDDLQWSDALTVSILDEALRELAGAPLFVLALGRPEVHEAFPKLWQSHNIQEIRLKGLSKRACARLIHEVLGKEVAPEIMARAIEHAAGNALFLEELIRGIAEGRSNMEGEAPATVVAMLQARIGQLEPGPRRAVRAAAIFGLTFWTGGVASILGLPKAASTVEGWLSALIDAELIQRHAGSRLANERQYGFRHALVRDAANSLLTESDVAAGHRLAAEFLEAAGERDPAVVAEHYERGGELERAVPFYERAGDDAARLLSTANARQCYDRALGLLGRLPDSEARRRSAVDLLLKEVKTSLTSAAPERNLERLASARSKIDSLEGDGGLAREDRLRLAWIDCLCGRVLHLADRLRDAMEYYQRVLPAAEELGDRELAIAPTLVLASASSARGNMRTVRALLSQVVEPLREAGADQEWIRARMIHAFAMACTGDFVPATIEATEVLEHVGKVDYPTILSMSYGMSSMIFWAAHDWPAMVDRVMVAIEAAQEAGEHIYLYLSQGLVAWARSFLGMHEQAQAGRAARVEIAERMRGRLILTDWFDASDAEMALNAGRFEEALARAQAVAASSEKAGLVMSQGIAERVWASAGSRLGASAEECDRHFELSIAVHTGAGLVLQVALTHLFWARALRARGEAASAAAHFERALSQLTASGCDYAVANAHRISA